MAFTIHTAGQNISRSMCIQCLSMTIHFALRIHFPKHGNFRTQETPPPNHSNIINPFILLAQVVLNLALELKESLLVMSRYDSPLCRGLKALQSLRTLEPSGMITSQPTLRHAISPLCHCVSFCKQFITWGGDSHIFDNVTVVTDEKERAVVREIDLHSNEA